MTAKELQETAAFVAELAEEEIKNEAQAEYAEGILRAISHVALHIAANYMPREEYADAYAVFKEYEQKANDMNAKGWNCFRQALAEKYGRAEA